MGFFFCLEILVDVDRCQVGIGPLFLRESSVWGLGRAEGRDRCVRVAGWLFAQRCPGQWQPVLQHCCTGFGLTGAWQRGCDHGPRPRRGHAPSPAPVVHVRANAMTSTVPPLPLAVLALLLRPASFGASVLARTRGDDGHQDHGPV